MHMLGELSGSGAPPPQIANSALVSNALVEIRGECGVRRGAEHPREVVSGFISHPWDVYGLVGCERRTSNVES